MSSTRNWLGVAWDNLRTSLWLVPGLMLLAGAGLGPAMLAWDASLEAPALASGWLSGGSGEDATTLLSTLLTSVITMASMVFSVTVVALSLAATSYGPRLIRTFRASVGTQVVLGIFMMTIVFLLIVLRSVRVDMDPTEVPSASVALGTLLALACVLALLAFIQGVARLIVADEVVRRVRDEFDAAVRQLAPLDEPVDDTPAQLPDGFEEKAARIRLPREGYVQAVACDELVAWAARRDVVVRLDFRPGDFVVEGDRKVLVHPPPADVDSARAEIAHFIVSGQERTPTQDIEFSIRHLVEVAVRALSPGINDPFTAMAVIDRLRGGLSRLANRRMPPTVLRDAAGTVRVVQRTTTYAGAVDAALNQIRQAGSQKPSILIHMLEALQEIAPHVRTDEQRQALARHAVLVRDDGQRDVPDGADRADIDRAFDKAMAALRRAP
jgi:uncharacterized membrane protein